MNTEHLKFFTNTLIIVNGLKNKLEQNNILSFINNLPETARLSGFAISMNSVELFILKKDLEKAQPILNDFKAEINS